MDIVLVMQRRMHALRFVHAAVFGLKICGLKITDR